MQEIWVWSLSREDPLEKEMATHSSILAWEIPWTEKPGRLQAMGFQRVRHDLVTKQHIGFGLSCFCWHLFLGIRYFLFDFLSDIWLFKSVLFNFHVFVFVFFTGFFPLWLMSNFMKVCVYKVGYTNPKKKKFLFLFWSCGFASPCGVISFPQHNFSPTPLWCYFQIYYIYVSYSLDSTLYTYCSAQLLFKPVKKRKRNMHFYYLL